MALKRPAPKRHELHILSWTVCVAVRSKIIELEEELKIVGNNMKSLEIAEQEVSAELIASHASMQRIF